jgi:hypothetical protein
MDWLILALALLAGGVAGIVFMCLLFISNEAPEKEPHQAIYPTGGLTR